MQDGSGTTTYNYDPLDRLTTKTAPAGMLSYGYDGEGRICAVKSEPVASTYTLTGYIYDSNGTRVAKGSLTQFTCDLNPADSAYIVSVRPSTRLTGACGVV